MWTKSLFKKNYYFVVFAVISVIFSLLGFFAFNDGYAQEDVQLNLEITNSFSASGAFLTGFMVRIDDDWYTSSLVQFYLNSNSGSQYQLTWNIDPFVFWSWVLAYSLQENIYLTGDDWSKIIYLQFYRNRSGGYYIETIDSSPFSFILDRTAPSKVILQNPLDGINVDNIVHFQWSSSIDTWVWFLEYTYSFSSDPTFSTIDYAGITIDDWVICEHQILDQWVWLNLIFLVFLLDLL